MAADGSESPHRMPFRGTPSTRAKSGDIITFGTGVGYPNLTLRRRSDLAGGSVRVGGKSAPKITRARHRSAILSMLVETLTIPPVENLIDRRGDEPQFVVSS